MTSRRYHVLMLAVAAVIYTVGAGTIISGCQQPAAAVTQQHPTPNPAPNAQP